MELNEYMEPHAWCDRLKTKVGVPPKKNSSYLIVLD